MKKSGRSEILPASGAASAFDRGRRRPGLLDTYSYVSQPSLRAETNWAWTSGVKVILVSFPRGPARRIISSVIFYSTLCNRVGIFRSAYRLQHLIIGRVGPRQLKILLENSGNPTNALAGVKFPRIPPTAVGGSFKSSLHASSEPPATEETEALARP